VKVTDQSIPPELQAAYSALLSAKPALAGSSFIVKTKPNATASLIIKPKRQSIKDFENAVDFLIEYLTAKDHVAPPKAFRNDQLQKLKQGIFDPLYWVKCPVESEVIYSNNPTSAAWTLPRAYAYPDAAKQPSVPTYGAGTVSSGNPAYSGQLTGDTFFDVLLKWKRSIFALKNSFSHDSKEPLFLKMTGSLTASADLRPSRAMVSAIIKRWIVQAGSSRLTTTEAPTIKPLQVYYRYRTPRGDAPYFNYVYSTEIIKSIRAAKFYEETGTLSKCVVLTAPMPMMGKRFNNNSQVNTTLNNTVELWQIKKSKPGFVFPSTILSLDGSTSTTSLANTENLIFADENHGLTYQYIAESGLPQLYLISGSMTLTAITAPWGTPEHWKNYIYYVRMWAFNGKFFIALIDDTLTYQQYYTLDLSGNVIAHSDSSTMPNIAQWTDSYNYLSVVQVNTNLIMATDTGYTDGLCQIYTEDGTKIDEWNWGSNVGNQIHPLALSRDTNWYSASKNWDGAHYNWRLCHNDKNNDALIINFTIGWIFAGWAEVNLNLYLIFDTTTGSKIVKVDSADNITTTDSSTEVELLAYSNSRTYLVSNE